MKYSFFVKFLAVLLCAAFLLGCVACGGGIGVLTSGGLYNRTVEEMLEENIRLDGAQLARQLASRYASTALGNVPVEVVLQCFPSHTNRAFVGNYGYALKDQEGTVVDSLSIADMDNARVYSFPISGQYISLVERQSEAERYPAVGEIGAAQTVMSDGLYVYDAVPGQGAPLTQLIVTCANGDSLQFEDEGILGTVYRAADGQVLCMITNPAVVLPESTTVIHVILVSAGELVYEASFGEGVGYFTYQENYPVFASTVIAENQPVETQPEETVPETVPETIPETVPETEPETVPETEPFVAAEVTDNIPESETAEVIYFMATLEDGEELYHEDEHGLGNVARDGEDIVFSAYDSWESETGTVLEIALLDADEEVIYKASHADGIGELYMDDDHLHFRSAIPQPPVEETQPETVPETVPETEPETVPETVPETEPETLPPETAPTRPTHINGKPLVEYDILTTNYVDSLTGQTMYVDYVYTPMPEYTLELYLTGDSIPNSRAYDLLEMVRSLRSFLLPGLIVSGLLFVLLGIYLLLAAGRSPKSEEKQAGGLNRIPLDLYLVMVILGIPALIALVAGGTGPFLEQDLSLGCTFGIGFSYAACLLTVGFLFALAAQLKTPGGFWWQNLLCARVLRGGFRLLCWLDRKNRELAAPALERLGNGLWSVCSRIMVKCYKAMEKFCLGVGNVLGGLARWIKASAHRFLSLLPLTWQWLLGGAVLLVVTGTIGLAGSPLMKLLCMGIGIFLIVYGAHCFGTLLESTRKMRKGDLNTKVDDKVMVGAFKEFAGELNSLAGVAVVAARKQMGSQQPGQDSDLTEKTREPLAAIVRHAQRLQDDLLTETEKAEVLESIQAEARVLEQLLEPEDTEDHLTVKLCRLDAVEAVAQVLEGYTDKLQNARLTPVVKYADEYASMLADEWMLWRSISILLDNAVGHALAGTRVYLDVTQTEDHVLISLRNISREIPEQSPESLADPAGSNSSGLGIAASLMQLQNGQLQIHTDGDLFKATLVFPKE